MNNEIENKVNELLDKRFPNFFGCGDSSCMVKKPKGMATNGGCRCDNGDRKAKQAINYLLEKIFLLNKEIEVLQNKLQEIKKDEVI